jgi:hypothetical protein
MLTLSGKSVLTFVGLEFYYPYVAKPSDKDWMKLWIIVGVRGENCEA